MAKRHDDALFIQQGACNPSGIAHSIVEACQEMRAEPGHSGTNEITSDPAIRLMVHQLAFLCHVAEIDSASDVYGKLTEACTNGATEYHAFTERVAAAERAVAEYRAARATEGA